MVWSCTAANRAGPLKGFWCSHWWLEVAHWMCAHIQPNTSKLTGQHISTHQDTDPTHAAEDWRQRDHWRSWRASPGKIQSHCWHLWVQSPKFWPLCVERLHFPHISFSVAVNLLKLKLRLATWSQYHMCWSLHACVWVCTHDSEVGVLAQRSLCLAYRCCWITRWLLAKSSCPC